VIPCHEFCGVVADLGYGTSGWRVGDQVFGLSDWYRDGAAAEYVAVEARNLAAKPRTCSTTDAASLPLSGLTAWQALLQHGRLERGETVLVAGAAGGLGVYAVQLARHFGARVIGAGRAGHESVARRLGSHEFVNAEREDWVEVLDGVDLALDVAGGSVLDQLLHARTPRTRVVSVTEPRDGVVFFVVEPDRAVLAEIAGLVDAGALRPVVGSIAPLADGRNAFASKPGVVGKSVLELISGEAIGEPAEDRSGAEVS
jgi:NADPH:quinone reductase-like Zn-dependent oxidoreductase